MMTRPATLLDRRPATAAAIAITMFFGWTCIAQAAEDRKVSYNRDVRAILSENCFYCHGPDKNHRDGKFRLDQRESAIAKRAIVPGKTDTSKLVDRIFTSDPDDLMPPPKTHKTLTAAQKSMLKRWIAQ